MTPPPPKSPQTQPRLRLTHPMLLPKPYPEQTLFQVRTVPSRKEKKRVILTQLKKRKMKLTKLTKSMTKQRNQRKLPTQDRQTHQCLRNRCPPPPQKQCRHSAPQECLAFLKARATGSSGLASPNRYMRHITAPMTTKTTIHLAETG